MKQGRQSKEPNLGKENKQGKRKERKQIRETNIVI